MVAAAGSKYLKHFKAGCYSMKAGEAKAGWQQEFETTARPNDGVHAMPTAACSLHSLTMPLASATSYMELISSLLLSSCTGDKLPV